MTLTKLTTFAKRALDKAARRVQKKAGLGAYYCKALNGESSYNICINSDLSVSCNCQDYDGSGQIGNLRDNSLPEIFDGPVARKFREDLANGSMPLQACAGCVELTPTSRRNAREKARNYGVPKQGIMVENTVVCNLECVACDRGVLEARKSAAGSLGGRMMSLEDIQIAAEVVRDNGIEQVCYHNLGEPFLSKRILLEMQIMREKNPLTRFLVSTNGLLIDRDDKREAALLFDHIWFSIDGSSQATVERYQIKSDFEKAYRCMKELVEFRDARGLRKPVIEWKYVVFSWNDSVEEIERALQLAREARVDVISFWKGGMPGNKGVSRRFDWSPYFNKLGEASWQGREVVLRPEITGAVGAPEPAPALHA